MCVCMCVCYVHMCVREYVFVYVHMYVYMCVCMWIFNILACFELLTQLSLGIMERSIVTLVNWQRGIEVLSRGE